jgi:hypothetical protein
VKTQTIYDGSMGAENNSLVTLHSGYMWPIMWYAKTNGHWLPIQLHLLHKQLVTDSQVIKYLIKNE